MSDVQLPESDALWDEWCEARASNPELRAETFAARFGERSAEAFDRLTTLLAVEEEAPLPSLVRVLQPDEDGHLRFAGFTLLRELGEGSAGLVYEAIDERPEGNGEHIALKLLNPSLGNGAASRDAILREARITARLDHPSIVRVVASGVEQGYAWVATELIEGEPVERLIDDDRTPADRVALALEVGLSIASALEHAHERGVLHRDLKPSNVVRATDGVVKVLDFGLARREGAAFGVSRTGEVVGTPLYMAPEQLRGVRDLDGRADLYALGLVMLELATGKRLLVREGALKTLARIARGSGRFSARFLAGLPKGLAGVLSRLLEPDRRDRYVDAAALIGDLKALREGRKPGLRRLGPGVRFWHWVVRRPVRTVGLVLMAGALVWLGSWSSNKLPISIAVDALEVRPSGVWVDGDQTVASLPLSLSLWIRGAHELEFFDGTYRYTFTIDVQDGGASRFFLPFGRIYSQQRPLPELSGKWAGEPVGFVQVGVRPADRSDHHGSFGVALSCPGTLEATAPGISTFPLPVSEEPYTLRIECIGYRPREIPISIHDGRTRSVMVELDSVEDPWHSILVSSPLDPLVDPDRVQMENLALRWETKERDGYSDTLVHRVGLGVVDPSREGVLRFTIPLPDEIEDIEEIQVLGIADPELYLDVHPDQWLLIEMGASAEALHPMLPWGAAPWDSDRGRALDPSIQEELRRALRESGARELHVRYRAFGEAAWILRTNALPRRKSDRTVHWDPALRLRVRGVGSEVEKRAPVVDTSTAGRPDAQTVIDLSTEDGVFTFDGGPPGELVSFNSAGGRDVDGDGVNDFALHVHEHPDHVEIRSGKDGALLLELDGDPGDDYGHGLVFVPDLDGDGAAELLVSAPQHGSRSGDRTGYVVLHSGRTGVVLGRVAGTSLNQNLGLGFGLDYLGELGGPGSHAAIVSTTESEAGGWGCAKLLSLPELRVLAHLPGHEQCDHFGHSSCGVGDVNADGVPDFAVGAYHEDAPFWDSGAVYVHSGDAAAEFPLIHKIVGEGVFDLLGKYVAFGGDQDRDGHADLLTFSKTHGILVLSGSTWRVLHTYPPATEGEEYCLPRLVNDFNHDHLRDIAVHGRRKMKFGIEPEVWVPFAIVFSTATEVPLLEVVGAPGGAPSVAPAPDVNGDGLDDLLVGMGRREGEVRPRMLFVLARK